MSRLPRMYLNTTYFHVIVQGINKEKIFSKEFYKNIYLEKLLSKQINYKISIIAYCIMDNHAHVLIHTDKPHNLSNYMRSINISYSRFYNKAENRVGYVFRDRFLSEPISDQSYLITCIRYIHNNPVKAKIVSSPNEYIYSSFNDYLNLTGIVTEALLNLINLDPNNISEALIFYTDYVPKSYNLIKVIDNIENLSKNKRMTRNLINTFFEISKK